MPIVVVFANPNAAPSRLTSPCHVIVTQQKTQKFSGQPDPDLSPYKFS